MSGVQVGKLSFQLRAPETQRASADQLKIAAQDKLLRPVLARVGDRVTAKLGRDAEVYVRELRLKLRMKASELVSGAMLDSVVDDLVDHVISQMRRPKRRDPPAVFLAPVQAFSNSAQRFAVELIAAAERKPGLNGQKPGFEALWRRILAGQPRFVAQCLTECDRLDRLPGIFHKLPPNELMAVLTAIDDLASDDVLNALHSALANRTESQSEVMASVGDFETPEKGGDAKPLEKENGIPEREDQRGDHRALVDPIIETDTTPLSSDATAMPSQTSNAPHSEEANKSTAEQDSPSNREGNPGKLPETDPPEVEGQGNVLPLVVNSNLCGLLYLVNTALQQGLPELFWRVGLSEGDALCAMFKVIVGESDDPATDCLSPRYPGMPKPLPQLQDWAQQELNEGFSNTLRRAAPDVDLADRATAIEVSLRHGSESDIASRGAGFLLAMAEHALGKPLNKDDWRGLFELQGRIVILDEAMTVYQTVDAIDLDVRRAGLDANPGWLPWLGKELNFVFADSEDGR